MGTTQIGGDGPPQRIEIYDNSHDQGANAVGAMVVAGPDGFEKSEYRKFNIRSAELEPGDDYAMTREVLTRRFGRLMRDSAKENGDGRKQTPADNQRGEAGHHCLAPGRDRDVPNRST